MTSNNNQAFVKTYSRRGQTAKTESSSHIVAVHTQNAQVDQAGGDAGVGIGAAPQITRVDPPQAVTKPVPATQPSSDQQIVAQQIGQQQRATSLQHIHTAYAAPPPAPSTVQPEHAPAAPASRPTTNRYDRQSQGPPVPHLRTQQANVPHVPVSESPEESKRRIESFQSVWEVDVFDVPNSVADLFFDAKRYQQIAERMSDAVKDGLQSVLVTSSQSGEGRSSVAIGLAMAAAASGIRVALVDADTQKPTLAEDLRLDLRYGWVDTIRGGLPIKEIAVYAVEDGVTLIPLMAPNGQTAATAYEVTRLVDTLKNHFDLLITDGPSTESSDTINIASVFDSALVVRDVKRTDGRTIDEISNRLQAAGVQGVGVVDNFV